MAQTVELTVGGMTCAACAARVERKLNKIDGVQAAVNYATGKAFVQSEAPIDPERLIAVVEATGYTAALPDPKRSDQDDSRALRTRLVAAAVLTVPVTVLAMVPMTQFPGWQWAALVFTTPVVTWAAWPFHRAAAVNARHRATTMDTLISMGVLAAFVWSLVSVSGAAGGEVYFEVAAAVTTFILLGRYLEARARRQSGAALRALLDMGAKDVALVVDGVETRVSVSHLAVGDIFVVRPGEKVATDGVVVDGVSAVDVSMLTGESVPVDVGPGSAVVGATTNAGGRLLVRATRVGAETQLAQMARLVEQAQNGKAEVQRLADRVSAVFVPIVMVLAVSTLVAWLATGHSANQAFTASVAVLIIACPCALGLATPTALLVGTGRGAQLGILIKGPQVLESTRAIDTIVLDKTGTVTTGHMSVQRTLASDDVSPRDVLRLAAAVEYASEHPIAQAIVVAARQDGAVPTVRGFSSTQGLGVTGEVEGRQVHVGRMSWVTQQSGLPAPPLLVADIEREEAAGRTVVTVAWDGQPRGALVVADSLKPTSAQAVAELTSLGLTPVLLTGDNESVAHEVAAEIGITEVVAHVLPEDKVAVVERLQREGRVVAMVGDGVNDAAALATADLGLAMGTGTDVAIEASDLTLVRGDLRAAADAIRLSRATLRTIQGNLFWAFAYNVAALPLAALGKLNPMVAAAAMASSSVFVVTNSLRLRRFRAWSTSGTT